MVAVPSLPEPEPVLTSSTVILAKHRTHLSLAPLSSDSDQPAATAMEYQAVLLAGSQGTALYPLCEETPPCLLSIATRPLLHFQLDYLERSGFTECIIVTRTAFLKQLAHSLDNWKSRRGGLVTISTAGRGDSTDKRLTPVTSPTNSTGSSSSSSNSSFSSFTASPATSFSSPSPFHIALEHLDQWSGTCTALRHLRPLLHSDFFCLQADLISTVPLHHLADIHRSRQAAVTMLVVDGARERDKEAAGKKKKDEADELDVDYMGIVDDSPPLSVSASSPATVSAAVLPASSAAAASASVTAPTAASPGHRLLLYKSSLELDNDVFALHKSLLRRCQHLTIHTQLRDVHCYLLAHWTLQLLEDKPLMASVKREMVPYIVRGQYRGGKRDISRYVASDSDDEQRLALAMSHSAPTRDADETCRCYLFIAPPSTYCRRAENVRSYAAMNADLLHPDVDDDLLSLLTEENHSTQLTRAHPRAQLAQSFVAAGVLLPGEVAVSVRRSVLGRGVRVGGGVKVSGSVVMDGCALEDGVVVTDSLLSDGCVVGKGSTVVNCKVGPRYEIPAGSEHKNEVLAQEREE